MKKTYSKPEIFFENFATSTSVAAGCYVTTPLPSYLQGCGYPIQGAVIFLDTGSQCNRVPDGESYADFCYHNPTDSNDLFNS